MKPNGKGATKSLKLLKYPRIYMGWTKCEYSKRDVDKAGRYLINPSLLDRNRIDFDKIDKSLKILNNWRSAHSFPLNTFQTRLRRLSKDVDGQSLVVQRLKRITSILSKLEREQTHTMNLSQMQDIGGCRSILSTVAKVRELENIYKRSRGIKHKLVREKDYIVEPKKDGYRSLHLIYKYYSDKNETYNGLLIEIQIRSKLQHAWATAVETVGTFTRQAIKSKRRRQRLVRFL
jgi:ppGpp synthetase/RelA/SpoT-type nucleotidyltranferase